MPGPVPAPAHAGLADVDPAELGAEVLAAWDGFLSVVADADLAAPSRLPGWTGRETCIHLGLWDDAPVLDALLASARTGDLAGAPSPDDANAALVAAHAGASEAEVVDALVAARDRIARFFDSGEAAEAGRLLSRSTVGPLPVLSLVHAGTYELAVHARDLADAPEPPAQLQDRGLAALVDVTGSLAARAGVHLPLTAVTPTGGWRFTSSPQGWTTERVPPGGFSGAGVTGEAAVLLDASAGRTGVPQLLASRGMVVQDMASWMRLAPLVSEVPGLPGGAALRTAIGTVSGVVGGVSRVLGRFRR